MNTRPSILFFGSFLHYSVYILEKIHASPLVDLQGVVTTPPQPSGRSQELKKTDVQLYAETHQLPLFHPNQLTPATLQELPPVDLIVTAGYGKLLPAPWLTFPRTAALNLHFSLLPKYRGANPAEWALLLGEAETGVTLIEMSPEFDTGTIVAQAATALTAQDTRESVYEKLYRLGGEVLPTMLSEYMKHHQDTPANVEKAETIPPASHHSILADHSLRFIWPPQPQPPSPTPYAKRFTKDDSFIAWSALVAAQKGHSAHPEEITPLLQTAWRATSDTPPTTLSVTFIEKAIRALAGYPGVWTEVTTTKGKKRLKIHSAHLEGNKLIFDEVQLEGKNRTRWNEIKNAIK